MTKMIRSLLVLAVVVSVAGTMGFAQSGEAVYRSNCQMCHGSNGVPNPGISKMMGIKPVTDPEIRKLTSEEMFIAVKNGKGKMHPFGGKLTDAEIRAVVAYYRSLK